MGKRDDDGLGALFGVARRGARGVVYAGVVVVVIGLRSALVRVCVCVCV